MTSVETKTPPPAETKGQPEVTELQAREVAEAARETEWTAPSFVRGLFDGKLRLDLIHPFPTVDPEEEKRAAPFIDALAKFMKENVDPEEIERNSKIPQHIIDGLAKLGAFEILTTAGQRRHQRIRAYGTGRGKRPRAHDHNRQTNRRRRHLDLERGETLVYQRHNRRANGGDGPNG